MNLAEFIQQYNPCGDAILWLEMHTERSWQSVWGACHHPEWLMFLLREVDVDDQVWQNIATILMKHVEGGDDNTGWLRQARMEYADAEYSDCVSSAYWFFSAHLMCRAIKAVVPQCPIQGVL